MKIYKLSASGKGAATVGHSTSFIQQIKSGVAITIIALAAFCHQPTRGQSLPTTVTNGLVAFYPFNGNANDESGYGDNGSIIGATLTTNRFGHQNAALSFDYTGLNAVKANGTRIQRGLASRTFSLWFKQSPRVVGDFIHAPLLSLWDGQSQQVFVIDFWGTSLEIYQAGMVGYKAFDGPNQPMIDGRWHHFVCVMNTNTISAYIDTKAVVWNGGLPGPGTQWSLPQGSLWIGYGISTYYDGLLDDVRVYNRALSTAEIQTLYTFEKSLTYGEIAAYAAVELVFNANLGVKYQLQSSTNLNTWANFGAEFTGLGGSTNLLVSTRTNVHSFFRLPYALTVRP